MKSDTIGQWLSRWTVAQLTNLPFRKIKRAYIFARSNGIIVEWERLCAHHFAGGDVESLVDGMNYAREKEMVLPFDKAAAYELVAKMSYKLSLRDYLVPIAQQGIRHHSQMPLG